MGAFKCSEIWFCFVSSGFFLFLYFSLSILELFFSCSVCYTLMCRFSLFFIVTLSFVHWTDMEFGEQLTAPALHVATGASSSSSAAAKAASSECASQEPGVAGGSSLTSCGTLNTKTNLR